MTEAEKNAWLAGLFEGEGCISMTGVNSVCLRVCMTDEDIVRRFCDFAGVGRVMGPEPRPARKPIWRWEVNSKAKVLEVLDRIEPWLGVRRGEKARQARLRVARCRSHERCRRGHVMGGQNLYLSPGGQRHCRACARRRELERRT